MCVCIHATVHMWRSEDTFQELVSFYHVGPWDNCIELGPSGLEVDAFIY